MGYEYERKYLVVGDGWRGEVESSGSIKQGYLAVTEDVVVRIRVQGPGATLTVKSRRGVGERGRIEVEAPVQLADAEQLLVNVATRVVEKVRYSLRRAPYLWTVDVFAGGNSGLVLLEVESDRFFELQDLPDWVGEEVTEDDRYQNHYLASSPYGSWRK